jgi:hypothetical protein
MQQMQKAPLPVGTKALMTPEKVSCITSSGAE